MAFFLLGGLTLFALDSWYPDAQEPTLHVVGHSENESVEPIVLDDAWLEQIRANFQRRTGIRAGEGEIIQLIRTEVEEEILYREALGRGLQNNDRSVRHRLVQKADFLAGDEEVDEEDLLQRSLDLDLGKDDIVIRRMLVHKVKLLLKLSAGVPEPTDDELLEYLQANGDRYRQPALLSFVQVFVSRQERGDQVEADAEKLLRRLREEGLRSKGAVAIGDRFPLGHEFVRRSRVAFEKAFGTEFSHAVFDLEPGQWHGPIASGFGAHLVWVSDKVDARLPDLESVRRQLTVAMVTERRERRFNEIMEELRQKYPVRIGGVDYPDGLPAVLPDSVRAELAS